MGVRVHFNLKYARNADNMKIPLIQIIQRFIKLYTMESTPIIFRFKCTNVISDGASVACYYSSHKLASLVFQSTRLHSPALLCWQLVSASKAAYKQSGLSIHNIKSCHFHIISCPNHHNCNVLTMLKCKRKLIC